MKNLMKSYVYEFKKSALPRYLFLAAAFLFFVNFSSAVQNTSITWTVGMFFVGNAFDAQCRAVMFAVMMVGFVCAVDFTDKTANYEILSGHTRREIYGAKTVVSLLAGVIGYLLFLALPAVLTGVKAGLGEEVLMSELLLRGLCSLFCAIRIMCEFICLAFIVRNPYIVMGGGLVLSAFAFLFKLIFKESAYLATGVNGFLKLANFSGEDMTNPFGLRLGGENVIAMLVSSAVFSVFFLLIGYHFFKQDDLR